MEYIDFLIQNWLIILILFLLFDTFLLLYIWKKRRLGGISAVEKKKIIKHWQEIEEIASSSPNQAVIEADKLLDYVLKIHGFVGSVADKLKSSETRFSDYQGLWRAHKLRNRLAHEVGVKISEGEARSALKSFRRALKDLAAM